MPLILVGSFSKPEEAHLLRLRLEAGGVPAHIQDENTVQMDWLLSNAIGGVRVMIEDEDEERAKEILGEPPPEPLDAIRPVCPTCLSEDTAPDESPRRRSFLMVLLVSLPLPVNRNQWKCSACGHVWDENAPG